MKYQKSQLSFEKKLAAYGLMGMGVFAAQTEAEAQIFYTDIHPDKVIGDTASFVVNINDDKFHDYMIFQAFSETANMVMIQLADSCELLGSRGGNYLYPFALDAAYQLNDTNPYWYFADFGTMNYAGTNNYGNWMGANDKYLGMKLVLNGKTHFGYMRLDVAADAKTFVVKDFAFEFTPEKPISTGQALATYATSALVVTAVNDKGNPSDIEVRFRKANDESKVSEYRLIFVRADDTDYITPAKAMTIEHYLSFATNGNDISEILPDTARDKSGDLISQGKAYKVYVISVADGINATEPILSWNGKTFTYFIESSPAGKPEVSDVADNGNGRDLQVSFSKAENEDKVSRYRIYVAKTDKAASFNIEASKGLGPLHFYEVVKNSDDHTTVLSSTIRDTDGDPVTNNVPYKVFVLSVADGIRASMNVLSEASDEIILLNTSSLPDALKDQKPYILLDRNLITIENYSEEEANFEIFSLNGQLLLEGKLKSGQQSIQHRLTPNNLYLIRITSYEKVYTQKIFFQ